MKRSGLIGNPIRTSLSPALFNAGYNGKYAYDLIEEADFETAYRRFMDGYAGINVTAPFKLDAFRKADTKSEGSTRIGAANLILKKDDGTTFACNTDYAGIILSILEAILPETGFEFFKMYGSDFSSVSGMLPSIYGHRPKAMIAGCGGAGRAAAAAAASMGYDTLLLNRTAGKAEKIASEIPEYGFCTAGIGEFPELFRESDLVIYTIPGSIPELENMSAEYYAGTGKIVLEANYKNPSFGPAQTACLEKAGGIYIPGRRWLLYQALTGFRIFTGENPDFQQMCKVI